jgi:hypothetical protein
MSRVHSLIYAGIKRSLCMVWYCWFTQEWMVIEWVGTIDPFKNQYPIDHRWHCYWYVTSIDDMFEWFWMVTIVVGIDCIQPVLCHQTWLRLPRSLAGQCWRFSPHVWLETIKSCIMTEIVLWNYYKSNSYTRFFGIINNTHLSPLDLHAAWN